MAFTALSDSGYSPWQMATLGLQGFGTSLGIFGALRKGSSDELNARIKAVSEERTSLARADADSFNAKVAGQLAVSEEQKTAADVADYRRVQSAKAAGARAVRAKSGLALEGSPLLVDENIFKEIDFGVQRIVNAGATNVTRLRNQETLLGVSAENNRRTASFARAAGAAGVSNIRDATGLTAAAVGLRGAADIYKTLLGGEAPDWAIPKKKKTSVASWEDSFSDWGSSGDGSGYW